ncbi:3-oxoacyl-(acyl-carrier-protein) synthase 1 [Cyanobium sp. PCC 7001]|uniref:beta-ketoacyl-[acyl-carrier-protein] synthase family protein n=1 Tax=Cyanobium sp. PCC 7001 TaxID=180281 RepID=UPI0001805AEC|nr:beta-ketoacyl-[acyl-carrier-protein] synthase family protein [Cyanobium sp. PCC 7001]EDY37928.1 3-oxoacyl-(acyl-carrier-protein) synthase 1 [Cyanobium sp. PCC 7001]
MSQERIAITGMGVVSPLGCGVEPCWTHYLTGQSGIRLLEQEWAAALPSRLAGVVPGDPTASLEPLQKRRLDRYSQLALLAALEAWDQAQLSPAEQGDGARIAVVVGCGIGGLETMGQQYRTLLERGPARVNPVTVPMLIPNAAAGQISIALGAHAGAHTPVSACASSAEALLWALMLLRDDRADVVIAGGSEAPVNPLGLAGFSAMRALSTRNATPELASSPYGRDRDGFVIAEGAGILVLERERDARSRGAHCAGFLLDAGSTADAHHMVTPDPQGTQACAAMQQALGRSGLSLDDLGFIQAHATGTPMGDLAEAQAISCFLGRRHSEIPVTAPKGQFGHMLGGAGAVETIMALRALQSGLIPVSVNAEPRDPAIRLHLVTEQPAALAAPSHSRSALKNAFGFGGHNISLVLQSA